MIHLFICLPVAYAHYTEILPDCPQKTPTPPLRHYTCPTILFANTRRREALRGGGNLVESAYGAPDRPFLVLQNNEYFEK